MKTVALPEDITYTEQGDFHLYFYTYLIPPSAEHPAFRVGVNFITAFNELDAQAMAEADIGEYLTGRVRSFMDVMDTLNDKIPVQEHPLGYKDMLQ